MNDVSRVRQQAEDAKNRGDQDEFLRLTECLMALGDVGEPAGLNALRAGVISIGQEKWPKALRLLRTAQALAIPGTLIHAVVLHNLALTLVESEAPNDVLKVVSEYLDNLHQYPLEGTALHGRMLIHRAAAYEILDPQEAPKHYDTAASVATDEIRECAVIDGAWALLQVGNKELAALRYASVKVDILGPVAYTAHLIVGGYLMHAMGRFIEATDLRREATARLELTLAGRVKLGMLVLLGGEISLSLGNPNAAEIAGVKASEIFREQRRQREYARAQEFLLRAVRARLLG